MTSPEEQPLGFADLGLPENILSTLSEVGYETPSPIQARAIPELLKGSDLVGQAQTGTGKTAAFALPLLARLGPKGKKPQLLVLTPTRELAIQVSEAFRRYGSKIPGFHVLPVYGGTGYHGQLRALQRGVQAIVGTPGRVMDLIKKGALDLGDLQAVVLDEADEMLRMGFLEDVKWLLNETPPGRQLALFSATMPAEIRNIAEQHLNDPVSISTQVQDAPKTTIRQRYWVVAGLHKLDALTRLLEVEPFEAMIIFVRTKTATLELAERLDARGHAAEALNGDMPQEARERTIDRLRRGKLDVLVATDVAARGLDVERLSHVVNFDVPHDVESYVHRIGRVGRAGRSGDALIFIAPREKRLLNSIERATKAPIEALQMPTVAQVNTKRIEKYKEAIDARLAAGELDTFRELVVSYMQEREVSPLDMAAALAALAQGDQPLLLSEPKKKSKHVAEQAQERVRDEGRPRERMQREDGPRGPRRRDDGPEAGMVRFRLEVGRRDGVRPGNIVGAIANEGNIDSRNIGRVIINDHFSTIDLPERIPHSVVDKLAQVRVCGRPLRMRPDRPPGRAQGRDGASRRHEGGGARYRQHPRGR